MINNPRQHWEKTKEEIFSERRLCNRDPIEQPEGIDDIDQEMQNEAIVDHTGSECYKEALDMYKKNIISDKPSATICRELIDHRVWDIMFLKIGDPDTLKTVKSWISGVLNTAQFIASLGGNPALAAGSVSGFLKPDHAVVRLWDKISDADKHKLFTMYIRENLPDVAAVEKSIEKIEGGTLGKDAKEAEYGKIMEIRNDQLDGEDGTLDQDVGKAMSLRYKGTDGALNTVAFHELHGLIKVHPELREKARTLNPENVTAEMLKDILPESTLRGAIGLGAIVDIDAKELIASLRVLELRYARNKAEVQKGFLKMMPQVVEQDGVVRIETPVALSDKIWASYGNLRPGQKFVVGLASVAAAVVLLKVALKKWDDDEGFMHNLMRNFVGIAGLGVGAYVLGGDKIIGNISATNKAQAAKEASVAKNAELTPEQKYSMKYIEALGRYASQHGEDPDIMKLPSIAALGLMPMNLIARNFELSDDGRGGKLTVDEELKKGLKKELMRMRGMNEKQAQKAIQDIRDEDKWPDYMAHIFYTFGLYAKSDKKAGNKEMHRALMEHMGQENMDPNNPLSAVMDMDSIDDIDNRKKYEQVALSGLNSAAKSNMSMARFIMSVSPEYRDLE